MKKKFFSIIIILFSITLYACSTLTPTPQPQKSPLPTDVPTPQTTRPEATKTPTELIIREVNLQELNTTIPDNVIEEIAFFWGGFGGQGCDDNKHRSPTFFPLAPKSIELMQEITISLCGVVPEEKVQIDVRRENTDTIVLSEEIKAETIAGHALGYLDFSYTPTLDIKGGEYRFVFTGSNWSLDYSVMINEPDEPRLWQMKDSELIFYQFDPWEVVKLLVYSGRGDDLDFTFLGWNQVRMDENGFLRLRTNIEDTSYAVLRKDYETITSRLPQAEWNFFRNATTYCGGDHNNEIHLNSYVMVISDYEDPNGKKVTKGTTGKIIAGPDCENSTLIWLMMKDLVPWPIPENHLELIDKTPKDPTPTKQLADQPPVDTINSSDGASLVIIPAGNFEMGVSLVQYSELEAHAGSKDLLDTSQPAHTVTLSAYKMYKTEVSNSMYAKCVAANACQPPINFSTQTRSRYYDDSNYSNYPVVYVTWNMAQDYCQWAGGRLPTEAEWEYAARGPEGFLFPWGQEVSSDERANVGDSLSDTTSVFDYPSGASPFGVLNMTGNVWEWVQDWYRADHYTTNTNWFNPTGPIEGDYDDGFLKVGKGGSYWISWGNSSPAIHDWYQVDSAGSSVGFRCAIND